MSNPITTNLVSWGSLSTDCLSEARVVISNVHTVFHEHVHMFAVSKLFVMMAEFATLNFAWNEMRKIWKNICSSTTDATWRDFNDRCTRQELYLPWEFVPFKCRWKIEMALSAKHFSPISHNAHAPCNANFSVLLILRMSVCLSTNLCLFSLAQNIEKMLSHLQMKLELNHKILTNKKILRKKPANSKFSFIFSNHHLCNLSVYQNDISRRIHIVNNQFCDTYVTINQLI